MMTATTETFGLRVRLFPCGDEMRFVARGSSGCIIVTAEGLASLIESKSQPEAVVMMTRANDDMSARLKAERTVRVSEVRRIARECQDTFPHGVGLLWYMVDHKVPRFIVPEGEFKGMVLNVAVLCQAMSHGMERNHGHAAAELDGMFKDIGRIIMAGT